MIWTIRVEECAMSPTASTALLAESIRDGRGALGWTHEPPEGADWEAHEVGEDCLLHLEAAEAGSVPFPGWLQPPMPRYGRPRTAVPSDRADDSG